MQMPELGSVWGPGVGGPILLLQLALVLISAMRLAASGRRLYLGWGKRIAIEDVLKGEADPDLLTASGLANRLPSGALLQVRPGPEFPGEGVDRARVLYTLDVADSRFQYFWQRCRADADSARRAGLFVLLLSFVGTFYSAFPIYFLYFNNSKHGGDSSIFWTARDLLTLLGYGWSCCAALYFASSLFERALVKRKICWTYFCARLKSELSRGKTGMA